MNANIEALYVNRMDLEDLAAVAARGDRRPPGSGDPTRQRARTARSLREEDRGAEGEDQEGGRCPSPLHADRAF